MPGYSSREGKLDKDLVMDTEQIKHWQELRQAYLKRLRVLELKEAQQGVDTPPHILTEIQDLREKIANIETFLFSTSAKLYVSQENTKESQRGEARQKVEIIIQGDFGQVTPEIQKAMVRALAAIAEISYDQVTVLSIVSGSIVLLIEIPEQAAQKLHSLHSEHDPILDEIGISSIRAIGRPTNHLSNRSTNHVGIRFGDNISFPGNITNSNITIKAKLNNVRQIINAAPTTNTQDKAILDELINQLGLALQAVPFDLTGNVEAVLAMTKQLIDEASNPQANMTLININADGLKEAAETLSTVTSEVPAIATQIVMHIMKVISS